MLYDFALIVIYKWALPISYPLDKVTAKQLFYKFLNVLENKLQMFEVSSLKKWKNKYISTDFKVI